MEEILPKLSMNTSTSHVPKANVVTDFLANARKEEDATFQPLIFFQSFYVIYNLLDIYQLRIGNPVTLCQPILIYYLFVKKILNPTPAFFLSLKKSIRSKNFFPGKLIILPNSFFNRCSHVKDVNNFIFYS